MEKELRIEKLEKKTVSKDGTEVTTYKASLENENGVKMTIEQAEPFIGFLPNEYVSIRLVCNQKTVSDFDKAINKLKEPKTSADIDHNIEVIKKSKAIAAVKEKELKKPSPKKK